MKKNQLNGLLHEDEVLEIAACVDNKPIHVDSESQGEAKEVGSSINLDSFKKLTKNKTLVIQNLIAMTIESFLGYKSDYKRYIELKDQKEVGLLTHKLKLTSNILCATSLEEAIKEARALLAEGSTEELQLQCAITKIHMEFDKCIHDLQIELEVLKADND